jgi:hypothetical protein
MIVMTGVHMKLKGIRTRRGEGGREDTVNLNDDLPKIEGEDAD